MLWQTYLLLKAVDLFWGFRNDTYQIHPRISPKVLCQLFSIFSRPRELNNYSRDDRERVNPQKMMCLLVLEECQVFVVHKREALMRLLQDMFVCVQLLGSYAIDYKGGTPPETTEI